MECTWNQVAGTSRYIFFVRAYGIGECPDDGHEEQPMRAVKNIKQHSNTKQEKAKNDTINFLGAKRGNSETIFVLVTFASCVRACLLACVYGILRAPSEIPYCKWISFFTTISVYNSCPTSNGSHSPLPPLIDSII